METYKNNKIMEKENTGKYKNLNENKSHRFWIVFITFTLVLSAIGYATTISDETVTTNSLTDLDYIIGDPSLSFLGENSTSQSDGSIIRLFNLGNADDGNGASGRMAFSFWKGINTSDLSNRGLSITVHKNGSSQPHHVSFYSDLKNGSGSAKALEWKWNTDTDGILSLITLNRLGFPETQYDGYYSNETPQPSGISGMDENFKISLDTNEDNSVNTSTLFLEHYNGGTTATAQLTFQDRATVGYDGTNNALKLSSTKKVRLYAGDSLEMTIENNNGDIQIGNGTIQRNITMTSPDGTEYSCGVTNGGGFSCS